MYIKKRPASGGQRMVQHRLHSACTNICLVKEGIGTKQKQTGQNTGRCSDILQYFIDSDSQLPNVHNKSGTSLNSTKIFLKFKSNNTLNVI